MKKKPDPSLFYSLAYINHQRDLAVKDPEWGHFIDTNTSQPADKPSQPNITPLREVDFTPYKNNNMLFDSILNRIYTNNNLTHYHRCSAKYYADSFQLLMQQASKIQRVVEVGPYFGDTSLFIAGALHNLHSHFDLVDINKFNLLSTYNRILQIFPEAAKRIRLFYGDLPIYIKNVMYSNDEKVFLHYQGSHNFNDVVRDLGSTYFVKNNIEGAIVSNPFVRTTSMHHYAFVDSALYAIFGANVQFTKLGEEADNATEPHNAHNPPSYFASHRVDGLYIDYAKNHFRYPHPNTPFELFLYQEEEALLHP